MPRKTIHRFVPNMAQALEKPSLRWLKSLMRDPNLLHINRRSVSLAVYIGILSAFFPIPGQRWLPSSCVYGSGAIYRLLD